MNRGKRLLSNTIILGFGTVLPKSATFLILPILTTALTKSEFGTYDLVITSTSFVIPIFSLLIEQAVFRFLLETESLEKRKEIISSSTVFVFISSILLFFISFLILNQFDFGIKLLISLYIVSSLYYGYSLQVCRGLGLLKNYSISSVTNSIVKLILIVILVWIFNFGLVGVLVSLVFSVLSATTYALISSKVTKIFSYRHYNIKDIQTLLIYSIPLLPNTLSWWIINLSDRWILTVFLGLEMTGIYSVASRIPTLYNILYDNFNLAWQESATTSSGDLDVNEYYTSIFNTLFNLLVGLFLILMAISPFLFEILINESYSMAYYQMPILFFAMFFNSLAAYYGGIYVAFKKTKNISASSLIAALLNVTINLLLINKFGLYAASISTLISFLVLALYRAIDVQRLIYINYNLTKVFGLTGIMCFVAIINYQNLLHLNILNFFLALIIAVTLNIKPFLMIARKVQQKIQKFHG